LKWDNKTSFFTLPAKLVLVAKVITPITATVEFITGIKQGSYGTYRSVLFKGSASEKIWKSFEPESEGLALLSKGAKVQPIPAGISKNGTEKHNIVLLQESSAKPVLQDTESKALPVAKLLSPKRPEAVPPTWETAEKQALSAKLCDHADLLKFSYEVVKHKFAGIADPHDIGRSQPHFT
jgi:hypothetical protein